MFSTTSFFSFLVFWPFDVGEAGGVWGLMLLIAEGMSVKRKVPYCKLRVMSLKEMSSFGIDEISWGLSSHWDKYVHTLLSIVQRKAVGKPLSLRQVIQRRCLFM